MSTCTGSKIKRVSIVLRHCAYTLTVLITWIDYGGDTHVVYLEQD